MNGEIILNIKDLSKLSFFTELIKNLDFVSIKKINTDEKTKKDKDFLKGIEQAVNEINLVNKGKLETRSAKQLLDEL
jgi:hypothetical protein